jgi:serine phosphatase RsbU (regulator of sigma subunit)
MSQAEHESKLLRDIAEAERVVVRFEKIVHQHQEELKRAKQELAEAREYRSYLIREQTPNLFGEA